MKKVLAWLLTLALLVGTLPTALAADVQQSEEGEIRAAEELPGVSRLERNDPEDSGSSAQRPYGDNEMVTVIVELDEPALLDYFGSSVYSQDDMLSAGEAVSAFLTSADAGAASEQLLEQQDQVLGQISSMQPSTFSMNGSAVKVLAQWTAAFNGMAVSVRYGALEDIRAIPGVKRAYVEHTYELPQPVIGTDRDSIYGYSYDMVNLSGAWDEGFTGKGLLVAVVDSGLDMIYTEEDGVTRVHEAFTDDSFRSQLQDEDLRYTSDSLAELLAATQLNATTGASGEHLTYANNGLYKNRKICFAYDYAGQMDEYGEIVGGDLNVQPNDEHGTHVAGTVAGYAETAEGEVRFSGVAPDAQLMIMKVFPDDGGGATDSTIISALEDTLKLGADVVNLSLGSDNGFAYDDTGKADIYKRMETAGIIIMTAAGNSGASTENNNYGGLSHTADPELSTISSPSVYPSNLSVASINNTVTANQVLVWTDAEGNSHKVAFTDPGEVGMKGAFVGETVEIFAVDGYGQWNDYYKVFGDGYSPDDKTGIALVSRGELSFTDKILNAQYISGIRAVIVYDNDPQGTELINMSVEDAQIPSAFISGQDGAALLEALEKGSVTMTVQKDDEMETAADGGQMSDFSSWGAGPGLELKPEITAPGGNIWSALFDKLYTSGEYAGSYGMMSGTSMATPHMSGLAALVSQYVKEDLGRSDKAEIATLTNHLLVSTALPQTDPNGQYYSPRVQGAGLANVGAAVHTPAYISVEDKLVGKLELGDDYTWSGAYPLSFRVENLTADTLTYTAKAVMLRPDTLTQDGETYIQTSDVLIKEFDLGSVTVPAGGTEVQATLQLDQQEIEAIRALFPNGAYIEGFIILEDASGSNPQIGLPYLAFLGDWTAAPILDSATWIDEPEDGVSVWNNQSSWGTSYFSSAYTVEGIALGSVVLGQNIFDSASGEQAVFQEGNLTISPNGDTYFDVINDVTLYQLRNAKLIVVEVTDKDTGELYFRSYAANNFKTSYNANYGQVIPCSWYFFTNENWDGTDLEGNVLPSGTECVYTVTAYSDGAYPSVYDDETGRFVTDYASIIPGEKEPTYNGHAMDMTGDVLSFDVLVDTAAPKLENSAVRLYEEDGRIYMTGTFHDDGALASIEVLPLVEYTNSWYGTVSYDVDNENAFYTEHIYDPAQKTVTFTADVTEYAAEATGQHWTGIVYVYGGDYGGNDRGYAVVVDATEGLVLSDTSALLYPGESFILGVNNNTETAGALTRTSSNPEVATIDEFGTVVALAPGQTVITVSDGVTSAVCIVAVEARPSKLESFELSIEEFSPMKPGSTVEVRIMDIQPADVDLTQVEVDYSLELEDPAFDGFVFGDISDDGMTMVLGLASSTPVDTIPKKGSSATLTVTLDGVVRTMTFSWEDLYETSRDEDLVPYRDIHDNGGQVVYVTQGETATLVAQHNNKSAHSFGQTALYTAENYEDYSYDNSTEPAAGLVLDGPSYCQTMTEWSGRLVNQEGYALPDSIRIFERSADGYESEKKNSQWYTCYEYDPATGEITLFAKASLYSAESTLVIRADGVEAPGNPAGTASGTEYPTPEAAFGPFTWEVTQGNGELTTEENVRLDFDTVNLARYTPSEPGISYVTATSRDKTHSLKFAIVSLPVQAESLTLDVDTVSLQSGATMPLTATLTPVPTLEEDAKLLWTSFDESVVSVDENGVLMAHKPGYAFIKVQAAANALVADSCIVQVTAGSTDPEPPAIDPPSIVPEKPEKPETPEEPDVAFEDVPDAYWAHDSIIQVVDAGLFKGVSATHFAPTGVMTRSMLVTVLWRLENMPAADYTARFTDVPNSTWYTTAVEWAATNEIVKGVGSGAAFAPNSPVTREQIATILWRMEGSPAVSGTLDRFTDGSDTSGYARAAMVWAAEAGLFHGDTAGTLRPRDSATRAEVAALIMRYTKEVR